MKKFYTIKGKRIGYSRLEIEKEEFVECENPKEFVVNKVPDIFTWDERIRETQNPWVGFCISELDEKSDSRIIFVIGETKEVAYKCFKRLGVGFWENSYFWDDFISTKNFYKNQDKNINTNRIIIT